jgi:hypothetical protein
VERLTAVRAELIQLYADLVRKRSAARTVLWIATHAGFTANAADAVAPLSVAQLVDLIRRHEAEEVQIRELLAWVDGRIAKITTLH